MKSEVLHLLCFIALNYIFDDSPAIWRIRLCIGVTLTRQQKKGYYEKSGTRK